MNSKNNFTNSVSRDVIIHVLYRFYLLNVSVEETLQYVSDTYPNLEDDWFFKLKQALYSKLMLESIIDKYLNNWTFARLASMEQAIMLFGAYELSFTNTDPKIVINEAINLSKVYGHDTAYRMVNAVLDKINKDKIDHLKKEV
ncbi:hypothetical protein ASO20_00025 [Mycoplasma sp. (ex Biomphalaria glabrata)]|uniref:transcription antitermination factor NusB n=1 Tax=Mycoplasma sp. (ex Biomphalaria glabrata) TaxID=1749074 RepID=UPI00073A8ECE|nr:transcription antitermination factor NusB [Mycoplasma sp. (ex Biomphalaria glabrata)]ALV23068.1 hypothetical protein ASO20_00025 [Mycoplasma sp. (ex Biomphalaria glabrata)]